MVVLLMLLQWSYILQMGQATNSLSVVNSFGGGGGGISLKMEEGILDADD